jgi:hypothetical protein
VLHFLQYRIAIVMLYVMLHEGYTTLSLRQLRLQHGRNHLPQFLHYGITLV